MVGIHVVDVVWDVSVAYGFQSSHYKIRSRVSINSVLECWFSMQRISQTAIYKSSQKIGN